MRTHKLTYSRHHSSEGRKVYYVDALPSNYNWTVEFDRTIAAQRFVELIQSTNRHALSGFGGPDVYWQRHFSGAIVVIERR